MKLIDCIHDIKNDDLSVIVCNFIDYMNDPYHS